MPTLVHSDVATVEAASPAQIINFAIGSGTNRLLVVAIAWYTGSTTTVGVTYDSVPLDRAIREPNADSEWGAELWYMVDPPTGSADVVVSWSPAGYGGVVASEWTGVHQSTPIGDTDAIAEGGVDVTLSRTLTTTSGDTVVTSCGYWDNNLTPTKGASDVLIAYSDATPQNEENECASSYQDATGASVTTTWTPGSGAVVGPMVAMVLKQAAGAAVDGFMWLA